MKSMTRILVLFLAVCLLAIGVAAPSAQPVRAAAGLDPAYMHLTEVATGLSQPVQVTNADDGSGRLFIVEQTGTIRIFKNGVLLPTPFLDVHTDIRYGGEQGLLALAFHPSYSSNGRFYVVYTAPRPADATGSVLTLKRFTVSANPDVADAASGSTVLTIDHPTNSNHNGGTLAFGPDGYLYWSAGDGGGAGDLPNNAQNLGVLLGKILRLDVDHNDPGLNYAIPTNNPFVESPDDPSTRGEIWAYGLRNSWRFSFDRATHDLYIGDVGQDTWEEIDFQAAGSAGGQNYGWRMYEGNACYSGPCTATGKVFPVTTYDHSGGRCAVTGGYAYRGSAYPALRGYYLFGDYCSGAMYAMHNEAGTGWVVTTMPDTPYSISSFGEDEHGELFLADLGGGIYHIGYGPASRPADFDGNGTTDVSVYRPSTGTWYVKDQFFVNYGLPGDIPVPGDYNGDGKADVAVYRPSGGTWYVKDQFYVNYGLPGDIPVPGDYNGDGKTDVAVFRPSTGTWYVKDQFFANYGISGDLPVPGDYNGDGKTDVAVFRPSTGTWYVKDQFFTNYGLSGDIPVRGDFDGNGTTDVAVFRPSTGTWYVKDQFFVNYGLTGDIPVPGDYNGDGTTDVAVFRPSTGTWYVKDQFFTNYGLTGDYPLPAPDTNGDAVPYQ